MSDFSIQKKKQGNPPDSEVVVINGEITILNAVEIKSVLLDVFSGGNDLHLDMKGVTEVDLTGLQLICSAHIASIKLGRRFVVNLPVESESLIKIVHDAGFIRHLGCTMDISKTCIWTGGEIQ